MVRITALALLAAAAVWAQEAVPVGPGITPPRVTRKVNPRYTRQARAARVQGTVVLYLEVDEHGVPSNLSIVNPVGFGLDEEAVRAVSNWRFAPGKKDGAALRVSTTLDVKFRFPGRYFDEKAERRRAGYNMALRGLSSERADEREKAAIAIQDLAKRKYPPAMFSLGRMHRSGEFVEKNPQEAARLIEYAAGKHFTPAMYDAGRRRFESARTPEEREQALSLLRDSVVLGSPQAQLYLAQKYEAGDAVPKEVDRARRYYRLCAAAGYSVCQMRLARLMLVPEAPERERVQAVAWLRVAAAENASARQWHDREAAKLTPEQRDRVQQLAVQIARQR
jgi:TonB family protein